MFSMTWCMRDLNKYRKLQIVERASLLSKGSDPVLDLPDWNVWLWASFAQESCDRRLRLSELQHLSFPSLVVQQPLDREENGSQWGLLFAADILNYMLAVLPNKKQPTNSAEYLNAHTSLKLIFSYQIKTGIISTLWKT